jgi:hypothetical protein
MKKYIALTIILALFLSILSSCGKTPDNSSEEIEKLFESVEINFEIDEKDAELLYPWELNSCGFTVADDGKLFFVKHNDEYPWFVINIFDLNGEITNTFEAPMIPGLSESYLPKILAVQDNIIYLTEASFGLSYSSIYGFNVDTEEFEFIAKIENFTDIYSAFISGNLLYLYGNDYELLRSRTRSNAFGERSVKSVNITTGEIITVFEDFPVAAAGTNDGGVMVYAWDDDNKSLYFQKLGTNTRIYNELRGLSDIFYFEMFGDNGIIYSDNNFLILATLDEDGTEREIVRDYTGVFEKLFITKSGYLFYETSRGINRVSISELTLGTVLNIAHTVSDQNWSYTRTPVLPRLGIQTANTAVDYYSLAFEILSSNDKLDLYYLHSQHDISDNIRRQGAFYTLNDVPGIREYLDAVFPYVKNSAVDENGNIWMLPIALNTPMFKFNELLCDEYGVDIEAIKTFEDLTLIINDLKSKNVNADIGAFYEWFFDRYFYQIMRKNNGYNREDFRIMAEFFYEHINDVKTDWSFQSGDLIYFTENGNIDSRDRHLFNPQFSLNRDLLLDSLKYEIFDNEKFLRRNEIAPGEEVLEEDTERIELIRFVFTPLNFIHNRFMSFPPISGMTEKDVTVEFIAVNPNSKNLDTVIDYLARLIEHQMNLENSFILKDRSTYTDRHYINDIYDIFNYEGNFIRFSLSSDLIYNDFRAFLGDEITLDEYLNRAEFKINAYLNE